MPTLAVILQNAPIAAYLASSDIEKMLANGLDLPDINLPKKIYFGYKILKKIYDNNPNYDGIVPVGNWLWELCGYYGVQAMGITGSGGSVAPVTPGSGGLIFPLVITNSDLTGTQYIDTRLSGKNLKILISNYNQEYLFAPTYFLYVAGGGIDIVAPGFDPSTYQYVITIEEYFTP